MKFNREKFIDETCGSLESTLCYIDELVEILSDAQLAGLAGSVCEYLDPEDIEAT